MKYLGDIIIVEHIGKNIQSKLLYIPDDVRSKAGGILAKVVAIGHVPDTRRKKGRYYPQDELVIGDTVIVPEQLGSRGRISRQPKSIVYDSEDVIAVVRDDFSSLRNYK